ncbi:MAG: ribonuclease Z [Deltaproteobacteria bacterium]|nr:ribonuclease Z [Deltaproteobacteria bacterium]
MRPSFQPRLINDPLSDPGLFVPFLFEKRALLFDIGDLQPLSSKELLKLTHVFVTHTHMDHFIGFDTILRVFLGREKEIHLFGPPGFFDRVEGKLSGYTWNLVDEYPNNLRLKATEVHADSIITRIYDCRNRFVADEKEEKGSFSGVILKEPAFMVEAALLDHKIACLGFSLIENFYINIMKEGLKELDLEVGPWINRFKDSLYRNLSLDSDFTVTWEKRGKVIRERRFLLGELSEKIALISPGQKIVYVADVVCSPENRDKIIRLSADADHLFIEAAFLHSERETALKKYHLTAREAGEIAREARVKQFSLFHFSPRYSHMADEIRKEADEAFHRGDR